MSDEVAVLRAMAEVSEMFVRLADMLRRRRAARPDPGVQTRSRFKDAPRVSV